MVENVEAAKEGQLSADNIDKPKLAIAFGGGASRGMMHLGVMKALEEEGIKADIVTGTSVGCYCCSIV